LQTFCFSSNDANIIYLVLLISDLPRTRVGIVYDSPVSTFTLSTATPKAFFVASIFSDLDGASTDPIASALQEIHSAVCC
jgi:hypothetical protein